MIKLSIEKLHQVTSYWYCQDLNGFIGKMTLCDSYIPEYILEDEELYYELIEYMFELEKRC